MLCAAGDSHRRPDGIRSCKPATNFHHTVFLCNPIFAIPESNWNASKTVLGTRKDRAEVYLQDLRSLLRSYENEAQDRRKKRTAFLGK